MKLSDYLMRERTKRNWSQKDLAKKSDCGASTIHKIETVEDYNPGFWTIMDIADGLGLPRENFIMVSRGIDPDMQKPTAQQVQEDFVKAAWAVITASMTPQQLIAMTSAQLTPDEIREIAALKRAGRSATELGNDNETPLS